MPATTAPPLPSYNDCRYTFIDANGCRADRNCADCLNTKGCRISTDGVCEPDTNLSNEQADELNYKRGLVVGNVSQATSGLTQQWHFPASQVTYCKGDDAVCNRCTADNYGLHGSPDDSRFCVGKDGCVCVLNCKNSFLEMAYCEPLSSSANSSSHAQGITSAPAAVDTATTKPALTPKPARVSGGSTDGSTNGSAATPASVGPVPANEVTRNQPHKTSAILWVVLAIAILLVCLFLRFLWRRIRSRRTDNRREDHRELEDEPIVPSTQPKAV